MAVKSSSLAFLAFGLLSAPALADDKSIAPSISVIGEASAEVRPDMATLSFEISDDRPTPLDASNENARLASAVIDGLKGSGVEAKDISTVGASLTPILSDVRDPKTGQTKSVVTGYHARNVLSVRVRDIDRAGAITGTSVQNGALYSDIAYELSDSEARRDALRKLAAENAVHRAQLYAEGAGVKLGALRSLSAAPPTGVLDYAPKTLMAPRAVGAQPVQIEPGVVALSEIVNATFDVTAP